MGRKQLAPYHPGASTPIEKEKENFVHIYDPLFQQYNDIKVEISEPATNEKKKMKTFMRYELMDTVKVI